MAKRTELGANWHDVVNNWCAGIALPVTEEDGWAALGALEEHWPEHLDRILAENIKSRFVIADAVDYGLTLSSCEDLEGFGEVLRRLRSGDKAALSELAFATALIKAGYVPTLEPPLNGKVLDTLIREGDENVYMEVITPELPKPMQESEKRLGILANALAAGNPGLILDVLIEADPDDEAIGQILAFLNSGKVLQSAQTYEIANVAFVACRPFDPKLAITRENFIDRGVAAIGIVAVSKEGKHPSMCMVRLALSDERAGRLMQAEAHHFSEDELNVLAIDVSNLPGTIREWVPLLERRLQPNLNRRFGAVVLFARVNHLDGAYIRRYYSVLRNPYAYREVPDALLEKISALDEYEIEGNRANRVDMKT